MVIVSGVEAGGHCSKGWGCFKPQPLDWFKHDVVPKVASLFIFVHLEAQILKHFPGEIYIAILSHLSN